MARMTGPLASPAIPAIPHISGPKREFQLQPPPAATAPRPLSPLVWGKRGRRSGARRGGEFKRERFRSGPRRFAVEDFPGSSRDSGGGCLLGLRFDGL